MFEFVPTIRTDRFREIKAYKDKGVKFTNENKYRLIDRIRIEYSTDENYDYEVKVDFYEVRFYITKNSASIYLTIYQLYKLLRKIQIDKKIDIVLHLNRLLQSRSKKEFLYRGIEYKIRKPRKFSAKHKVYIHHSSTKITYNELVYLIILIQEKSNYFCSISTKKLNYTNGILRMFIALLSTKKNHVLLKSLGWKYDDTNGIFLENTLQKVEKESNDNYIEHNALVERKYYLTEEELRSIMKIES